ncbi:MAG: 1,4-alpha-glucan branching enzyme, partial [Clostridia bacterium]|nr:1,4-alpha-glucan branching enzyme [Clostridia bacterium]
MDISYEIGSFYAGVSASAYRILGCHRTGGGFVFRVWAPNAAAVRLAGDFSGWKCLDMYRSEGLWELEVAGAREFDCYKFFVETSDGRVLEKCDPYAFHSE